jgi:hypothetical protein
LPGGSLQGEDFRVSGGILLAFFFISGPGDYLTVLNHNRPYRYFPPSGCFTGYVQGHAHVVCIPHGISPP